MSEGKGTYSLMYISSLYDDIQYTVARTLFREVGGIHHSYCSYVPPTPSILCITILATSTCPLSWPYTRQLLLLATRQHYHLCVLCMKYHMVHSTSRLEIDGLSILKQLIQCSIQYFQAQYPRTIMLPCRQCLKLPRVWLVGFSLIPRPHLSTSSDRGFGSN